MTGSIGGEFCNSVNTRPAETLVLFGEIERYTELDVGYRTCAVKRELSLASAREMDEFPVSRVYLKAGERFICTEQKFLLGRCVVAFVFLTECKR